MDKIVTTEKLHFSIYWVLCLRAPRHVNLHQSFLNLTQKSSCTRGLWDRCGQGFQATPLRLEVLEGTEIVWKIWKTVAEIGREELVLILGDDWFLEQSSFQTAYLLVPAIARWMLAMDEFSQIEGII